MISWFYFDRGEYLPRFHGIRFIVSHETSKRMVRLNRDFITWYFGTFVSNEGLVTVPLVFIHRSNYRTPLQGLYLCGSGAHPGGGVMGAPGRNAARMVIQDIKKQ